MLRGGAPFVYEGLAAGADEAACHRQKDADEAELEAGEELEEEVAPVQVLGGAGRVAAEVRLFVAQVVLEVRASVQGLVEEEIQSVAGQADGGRRSVEAPVASSIRGVGAQLAPLGEN